MSLALLIKSILQNWKLILSGLFLVGFLGVIGYMKYQNYTLNETNDSLVSANKQLETDIAVVKNINASNVLMIESLQSDSKSKDEILAKYRKDVSVESKKVQGLIDYIRSVAPADDGALAPVLANTVKTVQGLQIERANKGKTE